MPLYIRQPPREPLPAVLREFRSELTAQVNIVDDPQRACLSVGSSSFLLALLSVKALIGCSFKVTLTDGEFDVRSLETGQNHLVINTGEAFHTENLSAIVVQQFDSSHFRWAKVKR